MTDDEFDEDPWRERLETFRQEKEAYLLQDPESPLTDGEAEVDSLQWFPIEPEYRIVARYQPAQTTETVTLSTTAGPDRKYERVATFGFTLGGEHHVLTGYRADEEESLFVPFTDETNGHDTPAIGRYLDIDPGDAETGDDVVLEFNLAQLPYAAYSDQYASTLPPEQNHIALDVRAGERVLERH